MRTLVRLGVVSTSIAACYAQSATLAEDVAILLAFKATASPNGIGETRGLRDEGLETWSEATSPCDMSPTRCDTATGLMVGRPGVSCQFSPWSGVTTWYVYGVEVHNVGAPGCDADDIRVRVLDLENMAVTGSLTDLAGLTGLVRLDLGGTGVTGDIADLAGMIHLNMLKLDGTSAHGDAVALLNVIPGIRVDAPDPSAGFSFCSCAFFPCGTDT